MKKTITILITIILIMIIAKIILSNAILTIIGLVIIVKIVNVKHLTMFVKCFTKIVKLLFLQFIKIVKLLFKNIKTFILTFLTILTILIIGNLFNYQLGIYTLKQRVDSVYNGVPCVHLIYNNVFTHKPICVKSEVNYGKYILAYVNKTNDTVNVLLE
jgi:hypothetical protein